MVVFTGGGGGIAANLLLLLFALEEAKLILEKRFGRSFGLFLWLAVEVSGKWREGIIA